MNMDLHEKNKPTSPELWDQAISKAKSKFDVWPSAYASAWAAKEYKKMGGEWTKESVDPFIESVVDKMAGSIADSIKNQLKRKTGKSVKDYAEKAHESVSLAEQRFSQSMIDKMRKEYGNIGKVDPSQPTYKKLTALLDKLTDEQLKQLAQAKIKFVSGLALNRVNRRKMNKESIELGEATRISMNESVMTESINPKDIDPTGYYSIYSNRITGPYSSEKKAYHDGRGDLDDILTGAELIKKLKKGKYKKSSLRIRESVELDEANMPKFDEVLRRGKKLGDWNMMSYFLYDGNVWMLQSGRAVNQGPVEQFKKKVQPGLLKSLKFESVEIEEDWQSVNRKDNVDGLSQKAVDAYRRENPGSKLQTAVTEKNPKGKRAKRRESFCRRMKGMKSKLTSAETANDPDSRINKALRRWNCR